MSRWRPEPPTIATAPGTQRVLFLDRDGVVVVEKDYLSDPDRVELVPGAAAALRCAREAGYLLVGVSNQSGLGRGLFTPADFAAVMARLDGILRAAGCPLDDFYYCPHAPGDACACRKPLPGLLEEAARHLAWDPAHSWVIGDKLSDVELARAAGLRGILVRTGHGRDQEARLGAGSGIVVVDDLPAAIALILAEARR